MKSTSAFLICLAVHFWKFDGTTSQQTCGKPEILLNSGVKKVKGGQEAVAGSWPWQVRVGMRSGNRIKWHCAGSILTDIYIVTAAHCLDFGPNTQYVVRVGDHNQIDSVLEVAQKEHNVLRNRLHPRYGGPSSNFANDIAILRLATPITFRPQVSPVCIPPAMEEPAHGTNCFVTGWGKLSPRSNEPARLQEGSVKIMGKEVCTSAQYWGRLLASQVCASGQSNAGIVNACKGDSGGPLVCENSKSKKWILQGLVSFGPSEGCGTQSKPTIYTKVSHFVDWIQETTGDTALF